MQDPGIGGQLDAIIQVLDGAHGLDISPYDKAFEELLDYGFDGYIPKPIDGKLLEKMIEEHLFL